MKTAWTTRERQVCFLKNGQLEALQALAAEAVLGTTAPRWGVGRALFCCAPWSGFDERRCRSALLFVPVMTSEYEQRVVAYCKANDHDPIRLPSVSQGVPGRRQSRREENEVPQVRCGNHGSDFRSVREQKPSHA